MVVQQVDPWISGRDIDPGRRWALVLGRELEQSDFAVICLTSENRNSPVLSSEAGAVARSLAARVVPLLFGIDASHLDGPLAQFQSVPADEAGIRKLVSTLFESSSSKLEERQRDAVFGKLWPIFQDRIGSLVEQQRRATHVQSAKDLVDELVESPQVVATADVLQRLKEERERLTRELVYLNAQEEKLTQQDAPFSLVERAIEPTEHRLGDVNMTLKKLLDQVFAKLKPSQIEVLRTLVTPGGTRVVTSLNKSLSTQRNEDLVALSRLALIHVGEDGTEIAHDLISDYVFKTYGTA